MSATPPQAQPRLGPGHASQGKPAAAIAWGLYLLSIPSANLLVIVGLIVAYAGRDGATGVAREHIEAQIRLFWSTVWWTIGLWVGIAVGVVLTVIFIGLLFVLIFGAALLILHIWFTVKSALGLIALVQDRPPD